VKRAALIAVLTCACALVRPGAGGNFALTVHEQFFCGADAKGEPVVGEVLSLDGAAPQAKLGGEPLPEVAARALLEAALRAGARERPAAFCVALRAAAPQALADLASIAPLVAEPGTQRQQWALEGGLRLRYALARGGDFGTSGVLLLSDGAGPEVELWRHGLVGDGFLEGPWLLPGGRRVVAALGSATANGALRRTTAVRIADLARGEAELHNLHALDDYWSNDMESARRELHRALKADPAYPDALYNLASVHAVLGEEHEAIRWLSLAVEQDPHRVRVLARGDQDLRDLRRREAVRKLLGIVKLPPADEPEPVTMPRQP
jgi:tetratricopeptide (TPR) repeat protein